MQHLVWQAPYWVPGIYTWIWAVPAVWGSSLSGGIDGLGSIKLWKCPGYYTRERQTKRRSQVRKMGAVACAWGNDMRLRGSKGENWVKMLVIDLPRHHAVLKEPRGLQTWKMTLWKVWGFFGRGFDQITDIMFFPFVNCNCSVPGIPCFLTFNWARVVWIPSWELPALFCTSVLGKTFFGKWQNPTQTALSKKGNLLSHLIGNPRMFLV